MVRSESSSTRRATGAIATPWRSPNSSSSFGPGGHDEALIRKVVYENPLAFFSQCPRFEFKPRRKSLSGA